MFVIAIALAVGATMAVHACTTPQHDSQFADTCLAKVHAVFNPHYPGDTQHRAMKAALGTIAHTRAEHGATWECADALRFAERAAASFVKR